MDMPFLAVTINCGEAPPHVDDNYYLTSTMSMGNYSGGAVRVCGQEYRTHRAWLLFDPACEHEVLPADGMRASLSLYTPRFPGKLSAAELQELRALGFPVDAWLKRSAWHPEHG
eukprot:3300653-Amphidinium_carterae.1